MGLLFSLFKRKESTESLLENLSKRISSLQESRTRCSDLERRLASRLVFYSTVIYVVSAICWYYWGAGLTQNQKWYSRLLYTMPFILSPLLLVMLRRFLRWFFVRRITKAEDNLKLLENEREEIFRQLMEKETYKRVVELMKKYFPEKLKDTVDGEPRLSVEGGGEAMQNATPNRNKAEVVKKRDASPPGQGGSLRHRRTPALGGNHQNGGTTKPGSSQNPPPQEQAQPPQLPFPTSPLPNQMQQVPPQLVRPILPQNRTTTDRLIDWVLGDGVENRYALICASCCSHNGMALREEFEFLAFRCAYCGNFNPAKKARTGAAPLAPVNLPSNVQPNVGAVDVLTVRSPSRHGSQTNLSSTDSSSKDNVPAADNQEVDLPQSTRE